MRTEEPKLSKLRKQEKAKLWSRFRLSIIESIYREKFLQVFGSKCFKCGNPPPLDIDHHIPLALGGQLIPGNLVALCPSCNNAKLDSPPEDFYSEAELERLAPLLESQKPLFDFQVDDEAWERDKSAYLISLGLNPQDAWGVFNDPNHRYFMGEYPEPESPTAPDPYDIYALIRPLLSEYKSELQVLLALAKPMRHMSEESWKSILRFFINIGHPMSDEQEKLLRKYTKSWGTESENGFRVRCNQLDVSRERQEVCDALILAAEAIVANQPSEAWMARLENVKQRATGGELLSYI